MWNKPLSLIAVLALAFTACTSDTDAPVAGHDTIGTDEGAGGVTDPSRSFDNADCDPEIDRAMQGWAAAGFSGSVAFLGGDRECVAAYGTADPVDGRPLTTETVFSIGSITKAVTAAAIGRLVTEGDLDFDDRAGDLVPALSGPAGDATVAQLLLHTSGLTGSHGRDDEPLTHDEAVASLSGLDAAAPAGSEFLYSNAGYAALALIVHERTGDYRAHLTDQVLIDENGRRIGGFWNGEPAAPGPRAVGVVDDGETGDDGSFTGPHWGLDGSGGVAMTPSEMASWTRRMFTGDLVGPDGPEALLDLRFDQGDGTTEVPGWVAIDDAPFGEPLLGTSGGGGSIGHNMTVAWLPESERVFVAASNTPDVSAERLLQKMLDGLISGGELEVPAATSDLDTDLARLIDNVAGGHWSVESGGRSTVSTDDDAVVITALDADAMAALLPVPDPAEAEAHQNLVIDVIGGSTEEGRRERELLEDSFGPILSTDILGTYFAGIEYRTYLDVEFENGETITVWLALDDRGGIAAAAVGAEPPSLRFVPRSDGTLAPIDRGSEAVDLRLSLDAEALVVANGSTTHRLTPEN